jgi:hypothetical protein
MKDENDSWFLNCIFLVVVAATIGFAGWGLAKGSHAFHGYILQPTLRFAQMYLIEYGRVTVYRSNPQSVFMFSILFFASSRRKL